MINFIHMGGYGWYVWPSYLCVFSFLFWQWLIPFRRWKNAKDK